MDHSVAMNDRYGGAVAGKAASVIDRVIAQHVVFNDGNHGRREPGKREGRRTSPAEAEEQREKEKARHD